jgi:hypothetical protein
MTKAEEKALALKRAKDREAWHRRKKRVGFAAYKKAKARWQKRNAQRHTEHVQAFYERHGISGREARAKGAEVGSEPAKMRAKVREG